jgi:hypothetical protein
VHQNVYTLLFAVEYILTVLDATSDMEPNMYFLILGAVVVVVYAFLVKCLHQYRVATLEDVYCILLRK